MNDPGTLKQAAFTSHVFKPMAHSSRSGKYIKIHVMERTILNCLCKESNPIRWHDIQNFYRVSIEIYTDGL